MKSWMSFLIPKDEYKEKWILYIISEGGVLLYLILIGTMFGGKFFDVGLEIALLISIAFFLIYVTVRYIFSGIEYANVSTVQEYKKEVNHILSTSFRFVVIFAILYGLFVGIPSNGEEWIDGLGLLLIAGIFMLISNLISLKRSYNKNKDLI